MLCGKLQAGYLRPMKRPVSQKFRCGFVTGLDGHCRNLMLRTKYHIMRLRRITYPDVYSIPPWLGWRCQFLGNGGRVPPGRYDLIFSELNGSVSQLQYLADLVDAHRDKVVVLPGPAEIFLSNANDIGRGMARHILREAGHVLAYSPQVRSFADGLAEADVAKVVPWPFDYRSIRRIGPATPGRSRRKIRVLIGIPLRFHGLANNRPELLERCLADAMKELSAAERGRFSFHGFVYTREDRQRWKSTGFGRALDAILERSKSYKGFVRFVAGCDAVINLSAVSVLGRNTFISAALGKPGIFSDNVDLNKRLYPGALVRHSADEALRTKVHDLLHGLLRGAPDRKFLPDEGAVRSIGDYSRNAAVVRTLLHE